jgi:hypothetical protein
MSPAESREPEPGHPVAAEQPPAPQQPIELDDDPLPSRGTGDLVPGADPPGRARGRHEAPRSMALPGGLATVAAVAAAVLVAGLLATRLIGSAQQAPDTPAATTAAAPAGDAAPTSRVPGAASFGNLVDNWSFEQDLTGWQVVGAAEAVREPQGRTSGSCALVRAGGNQPGRIGLTLPGVVQDAKADSRYVASAWVRSTAPGLQVTVRLVGAGGTGQASRAGTATTLPGLRWRRVFVSQTVTAAGADLDLEVTATGVPAGDALLVDEVIVRQG